MADLGLTKLQAVNQMLFDLDGEPPVSALDPSGASIEAEAEAALDYVNEIVQARGWPDNTNFAAELTSSGSSSAETIQVPSDTLAIKGVSPHQYADITLQGDLVYDNRRQTTIFPDSTTINLDIIREVTYVDVTPKLKHLILQVAKQYFVRRKKGDPQMDEWLAEETLRLDPGTPRHPIEIPTDNRRVIEPQDQPVRESRR